MEARQPLDDATYAALETLARENPKVVCVSEVGLDFLPNSPEHEIQYQVFREHIRLARSLKLPIIFHSRESHPEVFRTLREEGAGEVGGVMHYFQGDEATARAAIDGGFFISLARPLTRLPELQEVARVIPLENLVLETDAFPQPFKKYRHNWTEPRHVKEVAQQLAEIKRITLAEVAEVTTRNLAGLLNIGPKSYTKWGR
jgi:TatD DNase family protein